MKYLVFISFLIFPRRLVNNDAKKSNSNNNRPFQSQRIILMIEYFAIKFNIHEPALIKALEIVLFCLIQKNARTRSGAGCLINKFI